MTKLRGLERVSDVHVGPSSDVVRVLDMMGRGGGFMGKSMSDAAKLLSAMCNDTQCTRFLSFPAAPVATGLRGVLVDMVRRGLADVIVTTCGTLDHDVARSLSDYYHGSFEMDDVELHHRGLHRLGNVLIPLENYGPLIEKRTKSLLSRLYSAGLRTLTTERLCSELGKDLASSSSLLYWAHRMSVPVFVPGITDGAVGSQLWLFSERHRDFGVDLLGDERRLSDIVSESKRTGALVIGGGISKHHTIWWNMFKGGLDYACYLTTADEYDGSLSGGRVREAVSWGKVKEKAMQLTLRAEATTVLPFLVSYALAKSRKGRR
jgi:deoxyhypusine synthase